MSRVLTNEQHYYDIADTIRQMKNVNTTYKPREMASALKDIYSNEVEGTLPLSFQANGNNLLNYRIDGASGGVGDRTNNLFDENAITNEILKDDDGTTNSNNNWRCSNFIDIPQNINDILIAWESDSAYFQAKIAFYDNQKNFISLSNYGINNTYLITFSLPNNCKFIRFSYSQTVNNVPANRHNIQIILGSTALPYEPYGYKVPVVVSGKNLFNGELLQGYYTDSTMSTLASKNSNYKSIKIYLKKGKYTLSSNINLLIVRFITSQVYQSNPSGSNLTKTFTFEIENDGYISLAFRNENNQTWDNSTNLQIEIGDTATTYEEYTSPTITTIYLDTLIYENESISLSDTNINIPTIDGTNVISIDTTVQPSNVYIQAPKDTPKMIEARERLEVI